MNESAWWELAAFCACWLLMLSLGAVLVTHDVRWAIPALVFAFVVLAGTRLVPGEGVRA